MLEFAARMTLGAVLCSFGVGLSGAFAAPPSTVIQPNVAPAKSELPAAQFAPLTPEVVTRAKQQWLVALTRLDDYLLASGPDNAAAWKEYLAWDALTEASRSDTAPAREALADWTRRWTADHTGLEQPQFRAARLAFEQYAHLAAAAAETDTADTFATHIETLRLTWPKLVEQTATADERFAAFAAMRWLAERQQAPELVAAVRQHFTQPNLTAAISARLASLAMSEPIDKVEPLSDVILGVCINGTVHVRGHTTIAFCEDPTAASFEVLINARAASNSVGFKHPVTLYVTGMTAIEAHKPMRMTAHGMTGLPAWACCPTNTSINCIATKRRIVERIAWRQSARQKSTAEAIGAQHAQVKTAERMDDKAARQIAETNAQFQANLIDPLLRRGDQRPELHFNSRRDQAQMQLQFARRDQLAAGAPPPELSNEHDFALRLHESSIINLGEAFLGGVELNDKLAEQQLHDAQVNVPDELKPGPDSEPWSMTYARRLPIHAKFEAGQLKLALRGESFRRGDQSIPDLVEITATYRLTDSGRKLVREGDVSVDFIERARLTSTLIGFKSFLRRKFSALFVDEMSLGRLPAMGSLAKLGELDVSELRAENGWLLIGARLATAQTNAMTTAE
ncbi:MAG: hypothetical protein JNM18_12610 [Planctomycetaceae bacterium]|nr:hypothetical protein [Planctomycetaceae bacterium]